MLFKNRTIFALLAISLLVNHPENLKSNVEDQSEVQETIAPEAQPTADNPGLIMPEATQAQSESQSTEPTPASMPTAEEAQSTPNEEPASQPEQVVPAAQTTSEETPAAPIISAPAPIVKENLYLFLELQNRQCWDYQIKKQVNIFTARPENYNKLTVEGDFFRIVASPSKYNIFAVVTEIPNSEQKTKLIRGESVAEAICEFIEDLEKLEAIKPQTIVAPIAPSTNNTKVEAPQELIQEVVEAVAEVSESPAPTTKLAKLKNWSSEKLEFAKKLIFQKNQISPFEAIMLSNTILLVYIACRVR